MYYLWREQYPKGDRTRIKKNAAKFILRTYDKVILFAELAARDIKIHDNNNHTHFSHVLSS